SLVAPTLPHYERKTPDGRVLDVTTVAVPDGGFVRTFTDITERRNQEAQIELIARQDHLTKLGNRVLLNEKLDKAFEDPNAQFAVHVIDLDRFKPINDSFGHPTGDKLLCAVADRLRANLRLSDVIARLGGDEFAIIECESVSRSSTAIVAKRLCTALSEPY